MISERRGEDNHREVVKLLMQWNYSVTRFLVPLMEILTRTSDEKRKIVEEYNKRKALKNAEEYTRRETGAIKLSGLEGLFDDSPPES